MNLLLDQGLPRSAAPLLRRQGVDAIHVGDIGMATAADAAILALGRQERRVVVMLDADFHALMGYRKRLPRLSFVSASKGCVEKA
jgi:predicted nuclease of predicted toxin-antitoxin system